MALLNNCIGYSLKRRFNEKMDLFKKMISVFLCVSLFCSFIAITANAEEANNDTNAQLYSNSYDLSGINGVGNILTKTVKSSETPVDNGYSFSYLQIDGKTAYVGFNNIEACTLVVAVYSEEEGKMLASGVKKVEANTFETTVNIEISSMPKYFILKAFLLDENMASLCTPYSVIDYTKQFEAFDKKTIDDFGNNIVINFDEQKDDNFAVLVDDASEIKSSSAKNTLVSHDEKTGKYIFGNIDSSLSSLSKGDIFEFESNGELYLIKIKSIRISGKNATIEEELEADYNEYFKYIDVDESSDKYGSDMTVDMTNAEEGIECTGISSWDEKDLHPQSLVNVNENWSAGPEWKTDKYIAGDSGSTVNVKVTFKIKAALGFNIRVYYDADWEWKWDFWNSYSDYFYCQVKIDFKVTGSISLSGKVQHDFYLGDIDFVTPVGIVVSINVKFHVEASLSVTLSLDCINMTIGFKYDEDSGFQNLCSGPEINISPKLEGQAEFKVGIVLGPGISFVKVVEISLDPEFGTKINLKTDALNADQLLNLKSVDTIHTCSWINCFNGEISAYASCKLKGRIFNKSKDTTISAEKTWKIADCHLRINPFEFSLSKCPNIAYRCDFTVVNNKGEAIKNLDIKSMGPDLGDNYKYNVQNATDGSGKVSFFYPQGKYTPEFYLNGHKVEVSKLRTKIFNKETEGCTIQVADTTKSITVKIDTTMTDGGGSGHNGGTGGSDLFMHNATFNANGGQFSDGTSLKVLSIKAGDQITPPSDPIKDGSIFIGWSPDIPDTMPSKDITFTATYGSGNTGYSISGDTLTISGKGDMKNYSGFGSTEWDSQKDSIKKIIINSGVTGLGDYAFAQFRNLETVSIPDTVTKIGTATFYECNSLQKVTLPSSVKTIGDYAFFNCYSITNISLGEVEQIGNYTFAQCNGLTSASLPKTVVSIGDSAFAYCNNLKSLTINSKTCNIYSSPNTLPSGTTIYGGSNSTAQKYAIQYGRSFVSITVQDAGEIITKLSDSLKISFAGAVPGNDYILLNVTGYGEGFSLSTSNLEYIDQLTAGSDGKITSTFIPKEYYDTSTTLLIGDFGNGIQTKVIIPSSNSTTISIKNNPGIKTINYREGIALTASIENPVDGLEIQWYVNGTPYSTGENFVYNNLKSDITVEAKIVNSELQPILKDGNEITDIETIKVKAGFWQKLVAFFKFTIFNIKVINEN